MNLPLLHLEATLKYVYSSQLVVELIKVTYLFEFAFALDKINLVRQTNSIMQEAQNS